MEWDTTSTRAPPQRREARRSAPSSVCADRRQPCAWQMGIGGGSHFHGRIAVFFFNNNVDASDQSRPLLYVHRLAC